MKELARKLCVAASVAALPACSTIGRSTESQPPPYNATRTEAVPEIHVDASKTPSLTPYLLNAMIRSKVFDSITSKGTTGKDGKFARISSGFLFQNDLPGSKAAPHVVSDAHVVDGIEPGYLRVNESKLATSHVIGTPKSSYVSYKYLKGRH